jgi:hypothetical protein
VSTARSDFDANNRKADSAPKQQVTASWGIKDLAGIELLRADDIARLLADGNRNTRHSGQGRERLEPK